MSAAHDNGHRVTHLEVRATLGSGEVIAYDESCPAQWFHQSGMTNVLSNLSTEVISECVDRRIL